MKQQKRRIRHDIMAQDAVRVASGWLWESLPDRFGPADPSLMLRITSGEYQWF